MPADPHRPARRGRPPAAWSEEELDEALRRFGDDRPAPSAESLAPLRERVLAGAAARPVATRRAPAGPRRAWGAAAAAAAAVVVAVAAGVALVPADGGAPAGGSGPSAAPSTAWSSGPTASPTGTTSPGAPSAGPVPTGAPGSGGCDGVVASTPGLRSAEAVEPTGPPPPGATEHPPLPPAPAAPLNDAAALGAAAVDPGLLPGQYVYVRRDSASVAQDGSTVPGDRWEEWVPADLDGEWLQRRRGTGSAASPAVEEWRALCGAYHGSRMEGWSMPTRAWLAALPRDPVALYERLAADTARSTVSPSSKAVGLVADLLRDGSVPADVRRAVFAALGYVPEVVVERGAARAPDGRALSVLRVDTDGPGVVSRYELQVDEATGQVVVERSLRGEPGGELRPRSVTTATTAVVDAIGVAPVG